MQTPAALATGAECVRPVIFMGRDVSQYIRGRLFNTNVVLEPWNQPLPAVEHVPCRKDDAAFLFTFYDCFESTGQQNYRGQTGNQDVFFS